MHLRAAAHSLRHGFSRLKFKIVTMAVGTGVLSAVGTAHFVLGATQNDIQRLPLQGTLSAVARQVRPPMWRNPGAMTRFLQDKPAVSALFDSIMAARGWGHADAPGQWRPHR